MVFNPVLGAPTDQPGSSGHVGSIFDGPGCFDTNPSSGYGELEVRFINQSYFRINCNRCTADVQSVEMVNRTTGERTGAYPARNGVVTIRPINPYGSWVIRTYCATGSCYSASVSVNQEKILTETGERDPGHLLQQFDYEQVVKDTDRDNFMSADEALEYGLIDKIFTNRA